MRSFAFLLGIALSLLTASATAQNCAGFTDVPASSPFCPDVTWITTYGITKGCGPSQYCPNETVTRLQMAAFMHRLGENPAFVNGGNAFGVPAILGTTDNNPLTLIVAGKPAIMVQPAVDSSFGFNPNVVNGSSVNSVAAGIAGATIAGGGGCNPGTGGICSGATANHVTDVFGTVGGGAENTAGGAGTVAGGDVNTASGSESTVAGGGGNTASANDSTVAGGSFNTASGQYSTVAGGGSNTASGAYGFVAGGYENTASGGGAAVLGGVGNSAAGQNSVVMGTYGETTSDAIGSFVFSDSTGTNPYGSGNPNEFLVAASGGIRMDTAKDYTTGCRIPAGGGAWSCSSSRDIKRDFTDVDTAEILAKVAALPVKRWRYMNEPADVRHIGTFAQDFRAAFGLGDDDKSISTVDADGIAMAAIQGLNAKVEQQQREIAELRERVQRAETLAADVVALKATLAELRRERETVAVK